MPLRIYYKLSTLLLIGLLIVSIFSLVQKILLWTFSHMSFHAYNYILLSEIYLGLEWEIIGHIGIWKGTSYLEIKLSKQHFVWVLAQVTSESLNKISISCENGSVNIHTTYSSSLLSLESTLGHCSVGTYRGTGSCHFSRNCFYSCILNFRARASVHLKMS